MARLVKHRYRLHWGDKWITTRWHLTEQDALAMDPEAKRIEGSAMVIDVPEPERFTSYTSVGSGEPD